MPRVSRFTPLSEIQAVVLDTETTGLDVATCRLVQISAVRFAGGALQSETFDRFVNPDMPIPQSAIAVHGITDAMVAGAPSFAEIRPDFDLFVGDAVIVGQSVGFDLAVLLREVQLAGMPWRPVQFLDTKLLAAALDPVARELGLDALAARLGVTVADRHHALGDALVTAEIFARLIPLLGAAGIRTLGDAQARSNAQTRIRARHADQGWYDTTSVRPPDAFESGSDAQVFVRLDNLVYRYRVEHLMNRSPAIVAPSTTIGDAIRRMTEESLHAVLAGDAASGRIDGIFTQGDALKVIGRDGAPALALKVESVMSEPVDTIPSDAFVYRALARMQRLGVDQLPVQDPSRRVVGMISLRDLLQDEAAQAVVLGDRLSTAPTPRALGSVRAELPALAKRLLAEDVPAAEVAAVLTAEMREILARAAVMAESRMQAEGAGRPPVAYSLLALGRVGRGEALFDTELEHALVFASGEADGIEAAWFAGFAHHLSDVLRAAGCAAGPQSPSAGEADWRRSLDEWRQEVGRWAADRDLAAGRAALFFDFRLAYGDVDLAEDLRALAFDVAGQSRGLAGVLAPHRRHLAAANGSVVDLASAGLAPIEAAARSLAVAARIAAVSTPERLAEACSRTGLSRNTADELTELHERLLGVSLSQQANALDAGHLPSSTIDLALLDETQRHEIEASLGRMARLGDVVRMALALV